MHAMTCRGKSREASHREAVANQLAEPFEIRGVANEVLEMWTGREQKLFTSSPTNNPDLCGMRQFYLKLALSLTQNHSLPDSCFFQAAQLFDASLSDLVMKADLSQQMCFARAAAAWMLCAKLSDAPIHGGPSFQAYLAPHHIGLYASQFSGYLGGTAVEAEEILEQESQLLALFKFNVHMTTVATWADTFIDRFDVATGCKVLGPHNVASIKQLCSCWASLLTWQVVLSGASPPKRMALGIFGLAMVVLKALPIDAISSDCAAADLLTGHAEQVLNSTKAYIGDLSHAWQPLTVPGKVVVPAMEIATMVDFACVSESVVDMMSTLLDTFSKQAYNPTPFAYSTSSTEWN